MSILQTSERVKLFEKKEETIPSRPSAVQRETTIVPVNPVDPVAPVDVPKDIAIGHKRHVWARQTLQEAGDMQLLEAHSERARDHRDSRVMFRP
jgi:hypothetical protein